MDGKGENDAERLATPLGLRIPAREELREMDASVRAFAGADTADHTLFSIGLRIGKGLAQEIGSQGPIDERVARGLARIAELGFGRVDLDVLDIDSHNARGLVQGRLRNSLEAEIGQCSRTRPAHAASGFSVGLLTGLVSVLSGFDVVCSPIGCARCTTTEECRFQLSAAHEFTQVNGPRHAPPGSARFFLGAVGTSLADTDVSLDDLLESTSDAVILIDNDDIVRYWNRGAERMFLFPPSEVVGRKVGAIVPQDLREKDELGEIRRKLDRGELVVNYITRRVRRDGVELWCSLTRSPLHDDRGLVVGSTAILRDITEQRRTEAELARARTLATVGEMSAKIAHEIKNPLAGIYAAVQVLARELPRNDPKREIFDEIGEEVRRLDQTVIDMLRFARPVPPKPRPTSLRVVVRDVVEPLRRAFPRIELRLDIDDDLILHIDERLMSQVFENLVLNALQAVEERGQLVVVCAMVERERVTFEIRDDGPGVPQLSRKEIFEPFVTTKTRGTGLGLSIARKNVEAHGGTLELDEAPEGGACFRVRIPLPPREPGAS
ncbi:MAG: PAS domain S-box protein [Planctomycetes bacterium]|nr:PAS domain S-box protein [Planctomycetota bacterium]